jgi:hypothetical protein
MREPDADTMSVTAANCPETGKADSRNAPVQGDATLPAAVTTISSCESAKVFTRNASPLDCTVCKRRLASDAPIYLAKVYGEASSWKARCAAHARSDSFRTYHDPKACEFCGRTVHRQIWSKGIRSLKMRMYCSDCYRDANRRAAIRRRGVRRPIDCTECSERFTPRRDDAVYCSGACRQKAYRKRRSIL